MKGTTMSKLGTVIIELEEVIQSMGIDHSVSELSSDERDAVEANIKETIRTNSCEADCSHQYMLGLL